MRGYRIPYLLLQRCHIFPSVGFGVIPLHFPQVLVVISPCHSIDIVVHNTNTEVSVLLLQGLDLEPLVVPWVIPWGRRGSKKVNHQPQDPCWDTRQHHTRGRLDCPWLKLSSAGSGVKCGLVRGLLLAKVVCSICRGGTLADIRRP